MLRQVMRPCQLAGHHVCIELWRPANRLARVVDDEVEPLTAGHHIAAERLHAWHVSKIEPKISSRSAQSPKSGSCAYRDAALCGNLVVTIRRAPERRSFKPA